MSSNKRPPFWQLIRDAVQALGGKTSNGDVRDWILQRYPDANKTTIQCQIIICTVNHSSRVHYPENKKPRNCNGPHDFLYRPGRGQLEWYDPARHGLWEIAERDDGSLCVQLTSESGMQAGAGPATTADAAAAGHAFAAEDHLRDYLVQHLGDVESGLELYVDDQGTDGVEFATDIGRIDILSRDCEGRLVVIELKVAQGPDAVCGQLMRYMGWVRRHLAEGQDVRGIIIAQRISDKIRYALADVPNVQLKEYELSLQIRDVDPLD